MTKGGCGLGGRTSIIRPFKKHFGQSTPASCVQPFLYKTYSIWLTVFLNIKAFARCVTLGSNRSSYSSYSGWRWELFSPPCVFLFFHSHFCHFWCQRLSVTLWILSRRDSLKIYPRLNDITSLFTLYSFSLRLWVWPLGITINPCGFRCGGISRSTKTALFEH